MDVLVGTSGFAYKEWRGSFYPEKTKEKDMLRYYAGRLRTVEINNTFYRLPPPSTVEQWEAQAPAGFLYSPKLGQFGSHRMKLRDSASWLPNHLDRVRRQRYAVVDQELERGLRSAAAPIRRSCCGTRTSPARRASRWRARRRPTASTTSRAWRPRPWRRAA